MTTDIEWEKWGARDPYFSVLTHPKFRTAALTDEAKEEFFALGRWHVDHVLGVCRAQFYPTFSPQRVLDFGCGVGRLVLPFAQVAAEVVGVDVSASMLAEARRNCDQAQLGNVELVIGDDDLSAVDGDFDLVHTWIVIQHIEVARGIKLFERLVARVRPGGVGALHVTFAWDAFAESHGVRPFPPPAPTVEPWWTAARRWVTGLVRGPTPEVDELPADADPEMQMNFYNLSQLMFILQRAGTGMVHCELTDHSGAIGALMYFRKPVA